MGETCSAKLRNFWREGWFRSEFAQILEGAAQPAARPSLDEQPVRGMHQGLIDRLSLCKKLTGSCVLDEARHVAVKVGREAPKLS